MVFSTIGLLMLCGTMVEVYQNLAPSYEKLSPADISRQDSMGIKVLKCFTIYSNGKKILNSDPNPGSSHLGCLSGIRFVVSDSWLHHLYIFFTGCSPCSGSSSATPT